MKYEKTEKYNVDLVNQKIMGPNPLKLEEELICYCFKKEKYIKIYGGIEYGINMWS